MVNVSPNRYAVTFLASSAALFWPGLSTAQPAIRFLALSAGFGFLVLGVAYGFSWPGLLGKTRQGGMLRTSYAIFWPYHLLNYASLLFFRLRREPAFHEIIPGLYLGGRLFPWEEWRLRTAGVQSVLDLTCEFSEVAFLRRTPAYYCLPLLDGMAPSRAELEAGIDFIRRRIGFGAVYVHCAMGHGRGPTLVAAYLVAAGRAAGVAEALTLITEKRPGVRLCGAQVGSLENFLHERRNL